MLSGGAQKFVIGLLMLFACSVLIILLKTIWLRKRIGKSEELEAA
jgi:hypothetical protein